MREFGVAGCVMVSVGQVASSTAEVAIGLGSITKSRMKAAGLCAQLLFLGV